MGRKAVAAGRDICGQDPGVIALARRLDSELVDKVRGCLLDPMIQPHDYGLVAGWASAAKAARASGAVPYTRRSVQPWCMVAREDRDVSSGGHLETYNELPTDACETGMLAGFALATAGGHCATWQGEQYVSMLRGEHGARAYGDAISVLSAIEVLLLRPDVWVLPGKGLRINSEKVWQWLRRTAGGTDDRAELRGGDTPDLLKAVQDRVRRAETTREVADAMREWCDRASAPGRRFSFGE